MSRILLKTRIVLGGSVWGGLFGAALGAIVGALLGAIRGDLSFGLDGALVGGGLGILAGAIYGSVVAYADNTVETPDVSIVAETISTPERRPQRIQPDNDQPSTTSPVPQIFRS